MVRWSYVLPRLLILVLVVLFVGLGLDPLIRWSLVKMGSRFLGARVEIGKADTSVWHPGLRLENVQLANPTEPSRNLCEFQTATLDLDAGALLRRRLVVNHGCIWCLRVATERNTSGALDNTGRTDDDGSTDGGLGSTAARQLAAFSGKLASDVTEQLESVRLAKQLNQRWPAEYKQVASESEAWLQRALALRELAKSIEEKPPLGIGFYQQGLAQIDLIRTDLLGFRKELSRLRDQAQIDLAAVRKARKHDTEYLRETFLLDRLDAQSFTEYLLGNQSADRIKTTLAWWGRGRQILSAVGDAPERNRLGGRGQVVSWAGPNRAPDFLIRNLTLHGSGSTPAAPFDFTGVIRQWTYQPQRHELPATVRLRVHGETEMQIDAALDYRGDLPRQQIVINVPRLMQPQRRLGRAGQLAIQTNSGSAHVWCLLNLAGDQLSGQIRFLQDGVTLTPDVAQQYGGEQLAAGLRKALGDVASIQAVVDLSGTVTRPQWKLRSNLGPRLAGGLQAALQDKLLARCEQLEERSEAIVDEHVSRFEQLLVDQGEQVLNRLQIGEQQMAQLEQQIIGRIRLPAGLLSRKASWKGLMNR